MDKQSTINAFREAILSNEEFTKAIFGIQPLPECIEDFVIALSSIHFADLMIDVEKRLGIEIAEECMFSPRISIGVLAEKVVERYV